MDCHEECRDSCTGPNNDNCTACANVKDGRFCVNKCPKEKYPVNGICQLCHETCNGCRGPRNTIASDGCITCDSAIINGEQKVERCLRKDEPCPGKKKIIVYAAEVTVPLLKWSKLHISFENMFRR